MFGSQGSGILVEVQKERQVLKSTCMFVGETARVLDSTALKVQSSHGHPLLQQWAWSIQESLGKHGQRLALWGMIRYDETEDVATYCHNYHMLPPNCILMRHAATLGRALL